MGYEAKDFSGLTGMPGFSDKLLSNHFTLYQGYVKNVNKLLETLQSLAGEAKGGTPEYAELKRRFGFEWNGLRLHELYFGNLGGNGTPIPGGRLVKELTEQWGSFDAWETEFRATGSLRGVGWAVLYQDTENGRLFNVWVDQHESGHLAGCRSILVMDVWEHAFMLDYGLKRPDYIAAFFKNINWSVCEKRLA
ncbi:Manganese/iron superoxide dismutase-like protein [Dehalogenimonas lykanthroporepellens BL-DC-9]|nr:Manganese/iron superoxide dismutase-like protein [Dehalogenimonas lykanthroporepellens BL-DC-9]